jgi:hypothetical protein
LVEAIMDVLNKANVTLDLADMIETFLLHQGRQTMEDCIKLNSKYVCLSTDINNLGWDSFVEGQLPYSSSPQSNPCSIGINPIDPSRYGVPSLSRASSV